MKTVLIVPTDGFYIEEDKPTAPGIARLEALIKIITSGKKFTEIAIIGGWPDESGITFAQKYYDYLPDEFASKVTIVDGSTNNTVDDLMSLMKILRLRYGSACIQFHFISSRGHFNSVQKTMKVIQADPQWIDSREGESERTKIEKILLWANEFDPLWNKWYVGSILRALANFRAWKNCTSGK